MTLIFRYENQDIALHCGLMLRECIRYESLARIILYHEKFFRFFHYVEVSTFDIASDAFSTFKVRFAGSTCDVGLWHFHCDRYVVLLQEALTKHKALVSTFLDEYYDRFFTAYQNLLNSENYVTRRQALKVRTPPQH